MKSPLEFLPNTYRAFFSGFPSLTTAQKQLIQPILNGKDVILQASTGSGKTEAVLAPATEKLMTHGGSFTIIYIVPTRALALDMNRRIKPIYKNLGLKSGIRTGDGKHLRDAKPHLLIMTPESLDVLLGSANQDNKYFLKHVQIIIIDEVHLFLSCDRGHQLAHLRHRLAIQSIGSLQTIALSATIDHPEELICFFNLNKAPFYYKEASTRKLQPCWVHLKDEEQELTLFFDDLYQRSGCKKLLVFTNSRKKCEQLYSILNVNGIFSGTVRLHYSNLSTQERKRIEASFRDEKIGICIATSTLELGIDIGDIDGVVLIGPPPSTTAFLQRIGRGNRRQQQINFWGICYGHNARIQLIRFLAFFQLAKEGQVEKCFPSENYSVLFQQILSCLYAKKALSNDSLHSLFKKNAQDLPSILECMIAKHWLKTTTQPGIYNGGWRYYSAFKRKLVWSNFPPSDQEYAVILENEKIAVLPLFMVQQLEIGDLFQLTGKVLKVLQIKEQQAAFEIWVEKSNQTDCKELNWVGLGPPVPFEVAQKMRMILLNQCTPEGLLHRTQKLLELERKKIARSFEQPNGILVHRLSNGLYRYETFLGSVANDILHHLIKNQFTSILEGLSVNYDEIGLECNEWIPFTSLNIPHTVEQFQEWISSHLSVLKSRFSWNNWLHWLSEEYQSKEIASRLYDPRVLLHFQQYTSESKWLPLLEPSDNNTIPVSHHIDLKGKPRSLKDEKKSWSILPFHSPIVENPDVTNKLTATQVQGYVIQDLCPRWARFQHNNSSGYLDIESHPRFASIDQELQSKWQQRIAFKKEVLEILQMQKRVWFATEIFTWQLAIKTVILDKQPLFLVQAKLDIEGCLSGSPDLMYIKHQGSQIFLEVWDIKRSPSISYARKWKIAFYAYLLDTLLKNEIFSLPVTVSNLGGVVYQEKCSNLKKTPFELAPYKIWMARLIDQWKTDSISTTSAQRYSLELSCTSCRYFSYCYQETLLTNSQPSEHLISQNIDSNDFPKNSKQWYAIHYDNEQIYWQCWENGIAISDVCIHAKNFLNEEAFQTEIINQLQTQWMHSVNQGKNPHFLVYESIEWHMFQKTFQSTPLKSLWSTHVIWTSILTVLQTHFIWPIEGRITPSQVGTCLGFFNPQCQPLSLYHKEPFSEFSFDLYRQIWNWCLAHIKSQRMVTFIDKQIDAIALIETYLSLHHQETQCHMFEISKFQKNPLPDRLKQFRAIGPIRFLGRSINQEGFLFSIDVDSPVSKFRVGDFLKLSPIGSDQIQDGFSVILDTYLPDKGQLSVRSLSQKVCFSKNQLYALDEDATDWNAPKITKVLNLLKNPQFHPEVTLMLMGHTQSFASNSIPWVEHWYQSHALIAGLNPVQQQALKLPFQKKIGLIEGPPGTGKTHLLVWTLIALLEHAKSLNRSIKILVTAQTHHAIDQILKKTALTLTSINVSGVCLWKYGRFDDAQLSKLGVCLLQDAETLDDHSCFILGATGYGVYHLLENKNFPQLFDWVVFDEASQLLAPYAVLSLIFGRGQALFYGDTQQLPPVLKGNYKDISPPPCSILQELSSRYSKQHSLRLNTTYRMNADICKFASDLWYDGQLQSVVDKKLELPDYPLFKDQLDDYIDPSQSMVVVQLDHFDSQQSSPIEATWIAKAVQRLIENYSISFKQIGIISPHRLQNNMILAALKEALPFTLTLPRIDTVERMQGLEFDIVIFSATVSDKKLIHAPFLKDYRRFNVALTRARKKFIFVASPLFFQSFPRTEKELIAQIPFEKFIHQNNVKNQ